MLGAFAVLPFGIAFAAMLPMPFIVWGSLVYQRRLEPRYADVREKVEFLNA